MIHAEHLADMLENTSNYVDSAKYFSWENFFEDYLIRETNGTPFQYRKSSLNAVYTHPNNRKRIAGEILDIDPGE